MILLADNILVQEVTLQKQISGLDYKSDKDDPYMIVKIISISKESLETLSKYKESFDLENDYLILRRVARDPFIDGNYFISMKDVRGIINKEELF